MKISKYILIFSPFLFVFLLLFGISLVSKKVEVKVEKGSFSEGVIGIPRFINPVLARPYNHAEQDLTELIFSRLLVHDNEGKIIYKLAHSLEKSENGKEYILTLKKNIYFHNGDHLTADDVVFTLNKIKDPLIKSPLQSKWEGISFKKLDEYRIKFTLIQAYNDFPYNLEVGILPKRLWENVNNDEFTFDKKNINAMGAGPYAIEKIFYDNDRIPKKIKLKKHPFQKKPYISHITIHFFNDVEDLETALKKGKLPRVFALFFNERKNKILKNKIVRSYIDKTIDRKKLVKEVFSSFAYPINRVDGSYEKEEENEKIKIKSQLEKLGWKKVNGIYTKKGEKLQFTISTADIPDLISVAEFIREEGKRNGILFHIESYSFNELKQKIIRQRDYEILLYGYIIKKPSDFYGFWHSSQRDDPGANVSMYANKEVDQILKELRKIGGKEGIEKIKDKIKNDVPASFLYSPAYIYLLPRKIHSGKLSIRTRIDRFNDIENWYIYTRKVWDIFIKNTS